MLAASGLSGYVSLATAVLVVCGHLLAARDRRRKAEKTTATLQEINVNVNGRLEAALKEIAELREALVVARAAPAETAV